MQRYVPPRRGGDESFDKGHMTSSTATVHRSQWHDERCDSPEQQQQLPQRQQQLQQQQQELPLRQQQQQLPQRQQQQLPQRQQLQRPQHQQQSPPQQQYRSVGYSAVAADTTTSLYDSGSWTDQVEQELGEGLQSMSLNTPATWSDSPVKNQTYNNSYSQPRQTTVVYNSQQHRAIKSPPPPAAQEQYAPQRNNGRGRGRGFQPPSPRLGSSPPRWKDRPDYPGNEFAVGGGGGDKSRDRDQFRSVHREEEEDYERHSVVSEAGGERRLGEKNGGRDLRETLEQRRRQNQQQHRGEGRTERQKEFHRSDSRRGSQSSLNSLDYQRRAGSDSGNRRKKERPHNNNSSQRPGGLPRPKKNTENFSPSHAAPEMRILFAPPGAERYTRQLSTRDVLVVADLFCAAEDLSIYYRLLEVGVG
jgi:hypothetical protein